MSDEVSRRCDLFDLAHGLTREQIQMAMPTESAEWLDRELGAMLRPICGHPPILRLVDGVYRQKETPVRGTNKTAVRVARTSVAVGWQKRGGRLAMASEMS